MNRDRRNVLVLATCQTLFGTGRSLLVVTAPLIAYGLAAHKGMATLPTSLIFVGTAAATIPASMFMNRVGRRPGFVIGSLIGALSGLIGAAAILIGSFWLFALATFTFGLFAGFGQLYRFAAADVAAEDFRAKAISLVLAGGVVSGFLGPELAKIGKDLISSAPFVGAYVLITVVVLLSVIVLAALDIPPLTKEERAGPQRPVSKIMLQPVFIAAALTAMVSQGVMNFLMTATPIAMMHASHQFADTAFVIEWHIFGMFAPGFFTGHLIRKFGEATMIFAGLILQFICIGLALRGMEVIHFWGAMLLLGVGWNFAFTAANALLTTCYTPAERAKTQGAMNFIIYGCVTVISFSSGALVHFFGWTWVNIGAIPLLMLAVFSTLWYVTARRREAAA